jgi:serine phosphatase RsbU (regulator of sigma subunit)
VLPGNKGVYGDGLATKIIAVRPGDQDEQARCIGGVYLLRHLSLGKSQDSLAAAQSLASQVASAVYRAEVHAETMAFQKMEQELEFAGRVQHSFLPSHVPQVEGWQLSAILEPARQTSGDFYDFVTLGEHRLGILVADVADKGTGAALYMALSRTLIRTYALQYDNNPSLVLSKANERLLSDTQSDQFVTVFYGVLQTDTGKLIYSSAGHNPAYIIHTGNGEEHKSLYRTGIPLGIFEEMEWEQEEIQLLHGDVLLMYTDGVTDAQDDTDNLYDDHRLLAAGQANLGRSAEEIKEAIIQSINDFVGDAPQFDDITLLVAVRK